VDDRYRYVIELGARCRRCRTATTPKPTRCRLRQPGLAGDARQTGRRRRPDAQLEGDSDAHIVRGLVAILFALYSGKRAREILATDATALFDRIGRA